MSVTSRPEEVQHTIEAPTDDGLFGPDSVTWKVGASPSASIATATAVLAQMLHPRVVRLLGQASSFEKNPEVRAKRTAQYGNTITYGDTAAAEQAGAMLRRIHSAMKAIDVETGEEYDANEPDLLMWVHATIPWAMLRAFDRWGPKLTAAEKDQYVSEQRVAAKLVGLDPETAPGNVAELEAYIESMIPKLAYTTEAGRIRAIMVPRKFPRSGTDLVTKLVTYGAVDLLPDEMRHLYGYWWGPIQRGLIAVASNSIVQAAVKKAPYERVLPAMREQATMHAFGAKAKRIHQDSKRAPENIPADKPEAQAADN